ncbi:MAG: hypothetical protein CM1200mP28_14090 [Deltaproteobacteria bacterium]|nr:MAG: hypothetical protein CM1200mP28_14090 [Deltaproteobacteria bacterium]
MPNSKFLHIPEQDTNDADKAVQHCLKLGFKEIHLLGADGGRQDQFSQDWKYFSNILKRHVYILDSTGTHGVYKSGLGRKKFCWDNSFILPVFGGAQGIVTKGLKYAFNNQDLFQANPFWSFKSSYLKSCLSQYKKRWLLLLVNTMNY